MHVSRIIVLARSLTAKRNRKVAQERHEAVLCDAFDVFRDHERRAYPVHVHLNDTCVKDLRAAAL